VSPLGRSKAARKGLLSYFKVEEDSNMRITLSEHGGFAPGIRRQPHTVDSATLSNEAAKKLSDLVAAASDAGKAGASTPSARDDISYVVQIEKDGESTELRQSDTTMTPAFAGLLEWFEKHREK